jgi:hypothetical protein
MKKLVVLANQAFVFIAVLAMQIASVVANQKAKKNKIVFFSLI